MKYTMTSAILGVLLSVLSGFISAKGTFSDTHYIQLEQQQLITKIGFGSCADEDEDQPVWETIRASQPDVFLMIGDNQYADEWLERLGSGLTSEQSTSIIHQAYQKLAAKPGFTAFRQEVPLLGTWDDHDYGKNDGGSDFQFREESQQVFLDFFGFAKDAAIRTQKGIYHGRIVGPPGKRVQFIMLDTRYHRDPLVKKPKNSNRSGKFVPSSDETLQILGKEQWVWLEQQLRLPADVRIIASSIQVVAYQHGFESWGNFPAQRQKLYDLIAKTQANGVIFLSGDRHLMEVSVDTGQAGHKVPYAMWDFTSSGLVQETVKVREQNQFREGGVFRTTNFGQIEIDWGKTHDLDRLTFSGFNGEGELLLEQSIPLSELQVTAD